MAYRYKEPGIPGADAGLEDEEMQEIGRRLVLMLLTYPEVEEERLYSIVLRDGRPITWH